MLVSPRTKDEVVHVSSKNDNQSGSSKFRLIFLMFFTLFVTCMTEANEVCSDGHYRDGTG